MITKKTVFINFTIKTLSETGIINTYLWNTYECNINAFFKRDCLTAIIPRYNNNNERPNITKNMGHILYKFNLKKFYNIQLYFVLYDFILTCIT